MYLAMKGKIWCEIEFIFYGKIKYLNIIFFLPFDLFCLYICIMHQPDLTHQQKYLLSCKEQQCPNIKTTP